MKHAIVHSFLPFGAALAACLLAALATSNAALIGHWEFDGNATDSSTSGLNGTVLGGAGFSSTVPGPLSGGQSLFLTGNTANDAASPELDGVNVPANGTLGANPFTLAYWIRPTNPPGGNGLERITSRNNDAFETAIGDANAVGGTSSPTGVTMSYFQGGWNVTNTTINLNEWVHVAWVNSGPNPGDMELYLDGVSAYTGPGVGGGRPGTDFMNIGTRWNNVEGFEGYIDDVRLYDTPLSAAEVGRLVPEPSAPLLALLGLASFVIRRRR